jgi:hypothetical protein
MAIQVSGTTVVDNSRNLTNIVGATLTGRMAIRDVEEYVTTSTSTSGTINFNLDNQAVVRMTANQTGNRTVNLQVTMEQSTDAVTGALVLPMGGSAYYVNSVQVNGTTSGVTTRWVGGAPTEGTASAYNVYSFTIFETTTNNYLVLASLTAYES